MGKEAAVRGKSSGCWRTDATEQVHVRASCAAGGGRSITHSGQKALGMQAVSSPETPEVIPKELRAEAIPVKKGLITIIPGGRHSLNRTSSLLIHPGLLGLGTDFYE